MGGDDSVYDAARFCRGELPGGSIATETEKRDLINRLVRMRPAHNTVFEHAVMHWYIKCPIFIARQWMRHRIGTFNERSLRYCTADRDYYIPGLPEELRQQYINFMDGEFNRYAKMVQDGTRKEIARGILGTAVYTHIIWTVNAWSFMNWLDKRTDPAAQAEMRDYAQAALELWFAAMPITADAWLRKDECEQDPQ
jgi:thymidylate synthase (FAD)